MADGIHALEGFAYQATVILELMLQHFQEHPEGHIRPEGLGIGLSPSWPDCLRVG